MATAVFCTAFLLLSGVSLFAASGTDYNKEFSDNYFRLKKRDADVHIRVYRKSPQTKVDPIGKQDKIPAGKNKSRSKEDGLSISALGKILQISLLVLLGALIYTISRRSQKKKRF